MPNPVEEDDECEYPMMEYDPQRYLPPYPGEALMHDFDIPFCFPRGYLPFVKDNHYNMWVKYGDHSHLPWAHLTGPPSHLKPPPPKEYPPNPMPGDVKTAEFALAYYNKKKNKHPTDYELVEAVGSCKWFESGIWVHVSFTAKPKNADDSSAKLFFAEYVNPCAPTFYYCRMLQGVKTVTGCKECGDHFVHPTRGLQKGLPPTQVVVRDLRPRSLEFPGRVKPISVDTSSSSKKSRLG